MFFFVHKSQSEFSINMNKKYYRYIKKFNSFTINKISWIGFIFIITYLLTANGFYIFQQSKAINLYESNDIAKDVSFTYNDTLI